MSKYQSNSQYCYPGTNVLINKFNIREEKALITMETFATVKRLVKLQETPIKGNFDFNHLKKIHKYIFQDVYPFAGKIRTENIAKGSFNFAAAPIAKSKRGFAIFF